MIKREHALNLVMASHESCACILISQAPCSEMSDVATLCVNARKLQLLGVSTGGCSVLPRVNIDIDNSVKRFPIIG